MKWDLLVIRIKRIARGQIRITVYAQMAPRAAT
jgi:hypothetical protein